MWTPPSSTILRASAPYSSGVYGIAGHCSRLAIVPEIAHVITTGSSRAIGSSLPVLRVLSISSQAAVIVVRRLGGVLAVQLVLSSPTNTFVIRLVARVGRPTTGARRIRERRQPAERHDAVADNLRPSAELTAGVELRLQAADVLRR